ncbi:MAG: S9 family peptidase [Chloroflexi bacterium]|nr:S9 family peptidase [Chloroflexota bacterium]
MNTNVQQLLQISLLACASWAQAFAQTPSQAASILEEVLSVTSVAGPASSPDGSEVAYTLTPHDAKGTGLGSEIRIVSVGGGGDRRLVDGGSAAWSPDGSTIAYFSSVGGSRQIWTIPAAGGEPRKVTQHNGYIDRFQWAPDSKHIAMLVRRPHESGLGFLTKAPHPLMPIVVDVNNLPMNQLAIIDVATTTVETITPPTYSVGGYEQWFPDTFSWSPDGERIVFTERPHAKAGSHLYGDIVSLTHRGQAPRRLVEQEGMDAHPVWSPDGRRIAYISTERYDWVTISYLYVVDPDTLKRRKITPDFDEKIKDFYWTADSKRILFIAGDRVASQIYSVDVAAAKVEALTTGDDFYSALSVGGKSDSITFIRQNAADPPDVYSARLADMKPKRLTDADPRLKSWPKVRTEVVRWKSFDGMEIEGLVHWPLDYREGRKVPLLVVPHGGPHSVMSNTFVGGEYRIFAQRGWAVFRPNFRGSGHYGEKFLRANLGSWGIGDYQDVMSGVDHLIEMGLADPHKLAMAGSSYGGYMTSWAISQTNRFKAAVAGAAISDVPSFLRTTDVPERFESYLGQDVQVYQRSSPMAYADNIKTPTLIWHGDADIRVPIMQGRHLYTALLKNEVPVEFIIYPNEPHGLQRELNRYDLLRRKIHWLHSWVIEGKRPEPLDADEPK